MPDVLRRAGRALSELFRALEEKPFLILLIAAGATIAAAVILASYAGWPHVLRLIYEQHSWAWLLLCLGAEVVAYAGYVLTVRDIARVDGGKELGLSASVMAVVAGFGVFAATRASGGFAVDYWALRDAGATRKDATRRVLGLTFLEFIVLSVAALVASIVLYFDLDGHSSDGVTLPSLIVLPIFALGLWLTAPRRVDRLSGVGGNWLKRTFADSVAGAARVRGLLARPREHGLGVLGNLLYWAGDILCLWAAVQLVDGRIPVAKLVLAYSGGYVLTRRALPAGGAGLVEVALTLALVGMGMHFTRALGGVVVYRLFNFWLPIIPALLLMSTVRDLRARYARAQNPS